MNKHLPCLLIGILVCPFGMLSAQDTGPTEMPPPVEEIAAEPIVFTGSTYADKQYYDGRLRYAVGAHNYQAMRVKRSVRLSGPNVRTEVTWGL